MRKHRDFRRAPGLKRRKRRAPIRRRPRLRVWPSPQRVTTEPDSALVPNETKAVSPPPFPPLPPHSIIPARAMRILDRGAALDEPPSMSIVVAQFPGTATHPNLGEGEIPGTIVLRGDSVA